MMMFDYKWGRGLKNLGKSDYVIYERSFNSKFRAKARYNNTILSVKFFKVQKF